MIFRHIRNALMIGIFALCFSVTRGGVAVAGQYDDAMEAYLHEDYATALRIFRPLAENGGARAQIKLGTMYLNGSGIERDYNEAAKWYRLAAETGSSDARMYLGLLHVGGEGVTKDIERAHMWFILAAEVDARRMIVRDNHAKIMTPEQIAHAQEMATTCKASNYKDCD